MALIGRLFVIFFGFLAACLVAGMIVVGAVLFPEFSDLGAGPVDSGALNIIARLRLHLHQRLCAGAGDDRGRDHRGVLYPGRADLCGRRRRGRSACYLGLVPFDTDTLRFEGIVRRHLEIMTGAGIVAGMVYWMIAGRNAGAWRSRRARCGPRRRCRRIRRSRRHRRHEWRLRSLFIAESPRLNPAP